MTEPFPGQQANVPVGRGPVVLRIALAVLLLIPGISGLVAMIVLTGYWANEGFQFASPDRDWMPLFIIPAMVCVLFSVLSVGILLRFARWRKAKSASLVLSVISMLTIVMGYQLLLDSISVDDTESPMLALFASIAALAIVSAPPFLHWWNARGTAEPPRN